MVTQDLDSFDPATADLTELTDLCTTLKWRSARAAGPHQFTLSSDSDHAAQSWLIMRAAVVHLGDDRAFIRGRTNQMWRYLDLPDGYTYWVMRAWINPPPSWQYDPAEGYVLNRKPHGI